MQDFDQARHEAALLVRDVLRDRWPGARDGDEADAFEAVDKLIYERPDLVYRLAERARRVWWYPRASMSDTKIWPLFYRGGDEFWNRTLAFRVPFSGTVVLALNVPLRRMPSPVSQVENPYGER